MIWKLQYGKREWFCGCGITLAEAIRSIGITHPIIASHKGPACPQSQVHSFSLQPRHGDVVELNDHIPTTKHEQTR